MQNVKLKQKWRELTSSESTDKTTQTVAVSVQSVFCSKFRWLSHFHTVYATRQLLHPRQAGVNQALQHLSGVSIQRNACKARKTVYARKYVTSVHCVTATEFRQTFANVRQRRPWVLKISILTLNFPQIRVFQLQSLHFSTKNFWQEEDFPTAQNLGGSPSGHDATDCPQVWGCPLLPFMVSGAPVHGCLTSHANDESALPS